jgi:hypothetical protein
VCQSSPTVIASGPIAPGGDAISIGATPATPCLPRFAPSGRPHQRSPHPPRYNEVSSAAMQLLAETSTMFARFKASKRL